MYLQDLIFELQKFWADHGCVIEQPVDVEVGAGTFHPATFLRVLGPEPWNAAFAQFCRRPTDGRYGENPNRLGAYYQFQVGLKPSPPDVQDLYLESLKKIGLELVVAVDGHKRTIMLPPALAGYRPSDAAFADGTLEVTLDGPSPTRTANGR